MRLIGRLLADQGTKHWKGYAFALVMTVIVAWTTTASAWIMRDVINEIFVAKKLAAVWMIGGVIVAIYTVKGFATYGQTVVLSRVANNIVAEVQRRIFDKMLAHEPRLLQRPPFDRVHRPPGVHLAVGERHAQPAHHRAGARRADADRPRRGDDRRRTR